MTNTRKTPEQTATFEKTAPRNVPLRTAIKAGADEPNANDANAAPRWRFRHSFGEPSNES